MAIPILPYSVEVYNSLPELATAKEELDIVHTSDILFTNIGQGFLKHHVETTLGLVLLHNHFLLEQNEKLVSVGPVAVPWNTQSGAKELDEVQVSSWCFTERGLRPYEFCHGAPPMTLKAEFQPFVDEIGAILTRFNLTGLLGICSLTEGTINGGVKTEFTSGRANVTIPFDLAPNEGGSIDAMWEFGSSLSTVQGKQKHNLSASFEYTIVIDP
ncbi:hypothetical protein MMC28_011157 [Mycoblastus sanguinarius]|nr:hypothetical protein [Mycoblastus sanguinarius]